MRQCGSLITSASRVLVLLDVGAFETGRGDRAEVAEYLARFGRQRGMSRTGKADAAEKPAAPFDRRFGARVQRRARRRQQRFEPEFGIRQPAGAIHIQAFEQLRRNRSRGVVVRHELERLEPIVRIGAAAAAQIAGERAMQIARADAELRFGENVAEFGMGNRACPGYQMLHAGGKVYCNSAGARAFDSNGIGPDFCLHSVPYRENAGTR